jgi:hypothetical protein
MKHHFELGDDLIRHLRHLRSAGDANDFIRYTGFVAVSAATVFELVIKDEFRRFAKAHNDLLGTFVDSYFERINGRIKIEVIKKDYLARFGGKYEQDFARNLKCCQGAQLRRRKRDVVNSYTNLITWRHEVAHEGRLPTNATFDEVCMAYEDGKFVLRCLRATLRRVGVLGVAG